nr:MAG: hypothetical protein [Aspergillus flavus partitivirus 1]BED98289.1 MAG: hypothetical protein [Aspergillus flavus partitivirus 1]
MLGYQPYFPFTAGNRLPDFGDDSDSEDEYGYELQDHAWSYNSWSRQQEQIQVESVVEEESVDYISTFVELFDFDATEAKKIDVVLRLHQTFVNNPSVYVSEQAQKAREFEKSCTIPKWSLLGCIADNEYMDTKPTVIQKCIRRAILPKRLEYLSSILELYGKTQPYVRAKDALLEDQSAVVEANPDDVSEQETAAPTLTECETVTDSDSPVSANFPAAPAYIQKEPLEYQDYEQQSYDTYETTDSAWKVDPNTENCVDARCYEELRHPVIPMPPTHLTYEVAPASFRCRYRPP